MSDRRRRWRFGALGWLLLGVAAPLACAGSPAKELLKEPELEGFAKCKVAASQMRPLIVEWKSLDRSDLESLAKQHLVAVNYIGCDMKVLYNCQIPGGYAFQGATRQSDTIRMADEDSLYANIPLHAADFEATLKSAGQLTVSMTTVGRLSSDQRSFDASELGRGCEEATHVVTGVTVGAFEFYSGADAEVGASVGVGDAGLGGRSIAQRENLSTAGVTANCDQAREDDESPPSGCGAFIRLEVTPVQGRQPVASAAASPSPVSDPEPTARGDDDGDGIANEDDHCPTKYGDTETGCPDELCDRSEEECWGASDCCSHEACQCPYLSSTSPTRGNLFGQDAGPSCMCVYKQDVCDLRLSDRPGRLCDRDGDCCGDESCDCGASGALTWSQRGVMAQMAEPDCHCR